MIKYAGSPGVTSVKDANPTLIPMTIKLHQNYPNPFNPETTLTYELPQTMWVKLEVYNITGQKVSTLVNSKQSVGQYSVKWHGKDDSGNHLSSGVYLYRLQAGSFVQSHQMLLVR